jgi:transglutaminase-like putative cysteine protease
VLCYKNGVYFAYFKLFSNLVTFSKANMKIKILLVCFCVLTFFSTQAQKNEYSSFFIADSLKDNANAIVRLNQIDITISSQRNMTVSTKRVITVLNERGLSSIDAIENYNKKTSVRHIQVIVFDGFGKETKKIKERDFKDQSAVGGSTLFSDSRYVYLDYTPIQYPFTVVYESEIETSTTAFIPQWYPLSNFYVSVEKSILNVNYPNDLGFKKLEFNFSGFNIQKTMDTDTQLSYTATNILAQKQEDNSPTFGAIFPKLMMGLEVFHLEDVDGRAKTWKEFGEWYSEAILAGTTALSDETKTKMRTLVGDEKNPIEKAKLIYNYVQQKSRYVSIQVGIGGWKPMLANDVDRLGYGDCKALTNYTKALLETVDVPSYNTILYGDSYKKDIESEFVSMQGNHMILAIPDGDKYVWLECTSQDDPFGYQGVFTDDREVLIMKPDGGEIVRTKLYEDKDNTQISAGSYSLSDKGDFSGQIRIASQGSQYNQKAGIEKLRPTEKEAHYKRYWGNINNLKINNMSFSNDKENVRLTETNEITAVNYGNLSGDKMMFTVNAYNQYNGTVRRSRNRKNPFEIQRGFSDQDEIAIALPQEFSVEFLPNNFELKSKFGEYKTEFIKTEANNVVYKRSFYIKKGMYSNTEYDEYRLFIEQVSKNDNAKIILTKI